MPVQPKMFNAKANIYCFCCLCYYLHVHSSDLMQTGCKNQLLHKVVMSEATDGKFVGSQFNRCTSMEQSQDTLLIC